MPSIRREGKVTTAFDFDAELRERLLAFARERKSTLSRELHNAVRRHLAHPPPREDEAPLTDQAFDKPISELKFSVRTSKCMNRLGIETVGELVQRTADELLESNNMTPLTLREVREKLGSLGLALRKKKS